MADLRKGCAAYVALLVGFARGERAMAFLEDTVGAVFKGGAATGIAIGAGVLLLVPGLLPAIGRMVRPLAVGVIKTGVVMYNEAAATVREAGEDIMAEVRAELETEGNSAQAGRTAAQSEPERRRSRASEVSASA
jgi:hypothetical protein